MKYEASGKVRANLLMRTIKSAITSLYDSIECMSARRKRTKCGQAMVEFVVVAGMMVAAVAILMVFFGTFREYGTRVLDLVGSEYP